MVMMYFLCVATATTTRFPVFKDMETLINLGLDVRAIGKINDENLPSLLGRVVNRNNSDFVGIFQLLCDNGFFDIL